MHSLEYNSVVSPPTSETRTLGVYSKNSTSHPSRPNLLLTTSASDWRREWKKSCSAASWYRKSRPPIGNARCFVGCSGTRHSHNPDDDDFRVKFFEIGLARIAVYVRWEKKPLTEALDVPDYVKAKARQIGNLLPDATFTVEQLRSEKKVYDPFLIASYADKSYYVEVWKEPEFEQKYT